VEATVKVRVGDRIAHTVAEGDGPVNALDSALRAALTQFFPRIRRVQLTDYKVRILESSTVRPPGRGCSSKPATARTSGARWA